MRNSRARAWMTWAVLLALVTIVMRLCRPDVDQAHVVLAYMLVVLGGSVAGGRALGLTAACAGFLLIDYYFQIPYDTFYIDNKSLDWLVLFSFLATSITATQLLARAQAQATDARLRADEVTRLSRLGSETLNAGTPQRALGAIARVIRDELRVDTCLIFQVVAGEEKLVASAGAAPVGDPAADVRIPLRVHAEVVGVLRLQHPIVLVPDSAQRRFLEALCYYAALGIERMRLSVEAEHAGALREADRMKDILLASVSHDLRTPLTTIKALAHDGALRGDENSVVIEEQADRLSRLVTDVLDLSRIKGGSFHQMLELNAAEDVIGAVARQFSHAAYGRRVITEVDLSQPALFGVFDFVHTLRVLSNLIENALRYSPSRTDVELYASRSGDVLTFTVADRGPGVPVGEVERIFEPFYRPPNAANDGGVGLGLSIAQRLAIAQGGSVQYAPRPDGGSVFTLALPACDPEGTGTD